MALIRWKPTVDVSPWSPVADLSTDIFSIRDEMNRMFDRFFNRGTLEDDGIAMHAIVPDVDIVEKDDAYILKAELPGVSKDDVKITLRENLLTIKGEKKKEKEEKNRNSYRSERMYGTFERTFTLPSMVRDERIQANFKDGVLTVEIPKSEEVKPKEIPVKAS